MWSGWEGWVPGSQGVGRVPRCSECGRELPGPFLRQDRAVLCPDCWQAQFVDGEEAYRHLQTCKACRRAFEVPFNYSSGITRRSAGKSSGTG
jgi:uncharacterized paraquat-inducible protein A